MKAFWYYVGIGLMLFLIAIGVGSCIALGDGRIQIKYDNTVKQ